jgi:NAD(P)H-hydrate repair Nnr-like enzyme with NAD(P)H-hydrate epimerase domain
MLLLLLLFCSLTIVVGVGGVGGDGLNPAMALVMVEAANIEA